MKLLGVDPRVAYLKDINSAIVRLPKAERIKLLAQIKKLLKSPQMRHSEEQRISAATMLISLLPDSEKTIVRLLKAKGDLWDYELHFSIFCFLDFVWLSQARADFAVQVPQLVEEYLSNLKVEKASAGWMAAHLMEDHWDKKQGLECLRRVVSNGRYASGRGKALNEIFTRLETSKGMSQLEIFKFLQQASVTDPSPKLRSYLRWKLKRLSKT